jgi:hypothetical protein
VTLRSSETPTSPSPWNSDLIRRPLYIPKSSKRLELLEHPDRTRDHQKETRWKHWQVSLAIDRAERPAPQHWKTLTRIGLRASLSPHHSCLREVAIMMDAVRHCNVRDYADPENNRIPIMMLTVVSQFLIRLIDACMFSRAVCPSGLSAQRSAPGLFYYNHLGMLVCTCAQINCQDRQDRQDRTAFFCAADPDNGIWHVFPYRSRHALSSHSGFPCWRHGLKSGFLGRYLCCAIILNSLPLLDLASIGFSPS